ncbi:MAG TPA: hypothetical protein VM661_04920 [Candidatus Sulfotelmatobacter sp.]|jgi:D-alanine-D-alanine ligase|nr:hypothetical protein [Candidatus Sulfotelmatobacter sp.]
MMVLPSVPDLLFRPSKAPQARILLMARSVPEEPAYLCRAYPGDGGYPAYYHRLFGVLTKLGYPVRTANAGHALWAEAGRTDLVFSLLNRVPMDNPEIFVASTCSFLGLACVGAGANVRALAEDKWFTKLAMRSAGLPVADGAVYSCEGDLETPPSFSGPYFVKNRFGAASEGISSDSVQDDWQGAARIAKKLMDRGMAVLVESFVPGIDLTVPVLGGRRPILLGVVRPGSDQAGGIITEELKRDDPLGYEMFDAGAHLGGFVSDVESLWRAVGPMDYLRLDYRFDPVSGRRVFLEFNLCCHIGRSGAICLAAGQWGLDQSDVLGHVMEYSLHRQGHRLDKRA